MIDLDALLGTPSSPATPATQDPSVPPADRYIVSFSGGKDSTALLLLLLELGVPKHKIELWHQLIDPPNRPFMDWPITPAYCKAFAKAFDVPLYFQAKQGGFEYEMLRNDTLALPTLIETPSGEVIKAMPTSKLTRRMEFPKKGGIAGGRWCSSVLKIDVASKVFTNDPRFGSGRFVMLTGERGEESGARAGYEIFEVLEKSTAPTKGRFVWQWRPIRDWPEADIWAIIQRWNVNPHPAYKIGFGRVSCMGCIFGGPGQWAEIQRFAPKTFEKIANYEEQLGRTITYGKTVREMAAIAHQPPAAPTVFKTGERKGQIKPQPEGHRMFVPAGMEALARHVMTTEVYSDPIILPKGAWQMPAGAFKKTGGPI